MTQQSTYERGRMLGQRSARKAVVLGGSMAGLLAARVLADFFDQVTLIERDPLPKGAENRKGVPQGRHLHALLTKGEQILSRLFPGLPDELEQGGATRCDIPGDVLWYQYGGYKLRFESGITVLSMSRPFLEYAVRRRVLSLENLRCIDQCEVRDLVATPDRGRVIGVRIQRRELPEEVIDADLVVDATGRGSHSPKWLEALGYSRPEENAVEVGVGYTTRIYRQRPGYLEGAKAVFTMPTPPRETRGGVLFPMEGDRWIVTLAGWLGDHAPAEEKGFLEFARSFPAARHSQCHQQSRADHRFCYPQTPFKSASPLREDEAFPGRISGHRRCNLQF